jgi:hypothetical protein
MQRNAAATAKKKSAEIAEQAVKVIDGKGMCVFSTPGNPLPCPAADKTAGKDGKDRLAFTTLLKAIEENQKVAKTEQKKAEEAAAQAEKECKDLCQQIAGMDANLEALRTAQPRLQQAIANLEAEAKESERWPEVAKKIEALEARIEQGERFLAAATQYQAAANAVKDNSPQVAILERETKMYDVLAQALAEGGPLRTALAKSVESAKIDGDLAAGWALDVRARPDGSILVNGRPVELCSESEQWRAGAMIGDLLARAGQVGWICLDNADILDKGARGVLTQWCVKAIEGAYQNVILLSSLAAPPQFANKPPGMAAYWIDKRHSLIVVE